MFGPVLFFMGVSNTLQMSWAKALKKFELAANRIRLGERYERCP